MSSLSETQRYLVQPPAPHLRRPPARLQPILARQGKPTVDVAELARTIEGVGELADMIVVESPPASDPTWTPSCL